MSLLGVPPAPTDEVNQKTEAKQQSDEVKAELPQKIEHPRKAELFQAIEDRNVRLVQECLDAGVPADATDDNQNTALILAAESEPDICDCLCKAGANVNAQNKNGVTPLMAAVKDENTPVIALLIAAGADPSIPDKRGRRSVDIARGNNELLRALGIDRPPAAEEVKQQVREQAVKTVADLLKAIKDGDVNTVWGCLSAGVPADVTDDDDDNSGLILAASGSPQICDLLLKANAFVNAKNKSGETALMVAVKSGNVPVVRLLVAADAFVNAKDKEGRTAIEMAGCKSELLEAMGVDPSTVHAPKEELANETAVANETDSGMGAGASAEVVLECADGHVQAKIREAAAQHEDAQSKPPPSPPPSAPPWPSDRSSMAPSPPP